MTWPSSQDYNEALQNPESSFNDPELRRSCAVANALGIPQPCSGNFADVYAVECPVSRTKWAVKCFTREVHGLRERYSEISKHLQHRRPSFTVVFQYLDKGVRIAGRWYPVLKMHWVEGFTLTSFVRANLDKPAMLDVLARGWLNMAGRLREANLAHGDLQHGNVLLVPDSKAQSVSFKLIDYDGMWAPSLANQPAPDEVGHPAYQHPERTHQGVYGPEIDCFPLVVIYCALRGLVVGGRQLWDRFDTGDNLLFRQQDFEEPTRSPLFAELLRMSHPEVHDVAVLLIDGVRMPLRQTPQLLEKLLPETAGTPWITAPPSKCRMTPPVEKTADSEVCQNAASEHSYLHKPTEKAERAAQSPSRSHLPISPTHWAALRHWAAAVRDDHRRPTATRQEAITLISILDAHHNMLRRHQHLSGELWESAIRLAEKLAQSSGAVGATGLQAERPA